MSNSKLHPEFSHPAEEAFAKILDFYGVKWEYEPRTFPLEWGPERNVTEAFTPDFYLPEQNLFIELTTLRSKLATHKNRKIRRLKRTLPGDQYQTIQTAGNENLMVKFGLEEQAQTKSRAIKHR